MDFNKQDEIDMSTIVENENIFSVESITRILRSGSDCQRTVVLFEIQQLLDNCLNETLTVIVPVICEETVNWSADAALSAAEALLDVSRRVCHESVCSAICNCAFRVVLKTGTNEMLEAWGEVLVTSLPQAKFDDSKQIDAIVKGLQRFTENPTSVSKKFVARISGALAGCLPPHIVQSYLLDTCTSLSGDKNTEVRGMAVESLAFIGGVVSVSTVEKIIWPRIQALLIDADPRIHAATVRTASRVLEARKQKDENSALCSKLLEPVFLHECIFARHAASQDQRKVRDQTYLLLEIISETFGSFLSSIDPFVENELSRKTIYKAFLAMATCNGPVVRRNCAGNFPAVAKALSPHFAPEVSSILDFLSKDTDVETRTSIAAGFHESIPLIGNKKNIHSIFRVATSLLKDKSVAVRATCLENLFPILENLNQVVEEDSLARLVPVLETLAHLGKGQWRNQKLLAEQLGKAVSLVPSQTLGNNVFPLLCQMAENGTYLVRKACMQAIAKCIWHIPTPDERLEIAQSFGIQWSVSGVFWMRISYIDCCEAAVAQYSRSLFQDLFMSDILRLVDDPVSNVRLRLARMIHLLAPSCSETEDFRRAIVVLKADNDQDVRDAMAGVETRIADSVSSPDEQLKQESSREAAEKELFDSFQARKMEEKRRNPVKKYKTPALAVMASLIHSGDKAETKWPPGAMSPRSVFSTGKEHVKMSYKELSGRLRADDSDTPKAADDSVLFPEPRLESNAPLRAIASHPVTPRYAQSKPEDGSARVESTTWPHRVIARRLKALARLKKERKQWQNQRNAPGSS